MIRKWTAVLLALALLAGLAGCGTAPAPAAKPEPVVTEPVATAEPVVTAEETPGLDAYNLELEQVLRSVSYAEGSWDVVCRSLTGKGYAELGSGEAMVSASLIKLFVMAAVYERYGTDGLGAEQREDLRLMITISDNEACNRLTRLLGDGDAAAGEAAVNAYAEREGYTGTRMLRLMLEDNGLQNYTTAADCALLLERIYRGACVSEAASGEMLALLGAQEITNGLDALPEGSLCAHKTGNLLLLVCGDCGIVSAGEEAWVLCVICNGQTDEAAPQETIQTLTQAVYGYFCG